jgi:catecholate siderophore receptor
MKRLDNGITINNDTRFSFYERDFSSTNPASLNYASLQRLLAGGNVSLAYGAGGGSTYLQRGWGIQNVLSAKGEFHTGSFRHKAMVGLDTIYQRDHRDMGTWTGRMNNQTVMNPIFYNSRVRRSVMAAPRAMRTRSTLAYSPTTASGSTTSSR